MAFFNMVQQKTRDFADSAKLSSTISEEEKKINRIYTEIGKRYYAAHSLDEVPEFPEQVKAISVSRQKIKDCQEQLQKLKSVVRCPVCGAEVPGSSAFCPGCGSPMRSSGLSAGTCSKCSSPLQPGVKFCTRCGTPVSAAPKPAQEPPVPQPDQVYTPPVYEPPFYESPVFQPEPIQEATMSESAVYDAPPAESGDFYFTPSLNEVQRCPQCGAELEPGSVFCTNCGSRLED